MPANISAASGHAASAAQLAIQNASQAGDGLANASAGTGDDQAASFAALFRQLAARQRSGDDAPIALRLQAGPADSDADATDALSALLPFLEGMGMLPADGEAADGSAQEDMATQLIAPEDAAIPLAAPAITAATAPDDATKGLDPGHRSLSATEVSDQADRGDETTAVQTGKSGQAAAQAAGTETGRGRDFAAQLVSAIDAGKEGAHAPGGTSTAVHQVIAATPPNGNTSATSSLQVAQPVGTHGWSEEVGNRIVWMANRQEGRAELVLTPPQMGRIEVSLSITGDQASANFASTNPAVREALEAALPRLREVLADAGIQLGQAQVGAENPGQTTREDKNGDNPVFDRTDDRDTGSLRMTETAMSSPAGLKSGRGLVDVFA